MSTLDSGGQEEERTDVAEVPSDHEHKFLPAADSDGKLGHLPLHAALMFEQAAEQTRMALCIADPRQPDSPVVYVNQAFLDLTGYERDEVLGRNCRFLQGEGTNRRVVAEIREGLENEAVQVKILRNYRKDGSAFWNSLHIGPIYDPDGNLSHFFSSQWDVTDLLEERDRMAVATRLNEELQHRSRNLFGVINAMIQLSVKTAEDKHDLAAKLSERVLALSRAHTISAKSDGDAHDADLRELIEAILLPYGNGVAERLNVEGEDVTLDKTQVTPLGLALHELSTNALKYGALSATGGAVHVNWIRDGGRLEISWRETGGPKLGSDEDRPKGSGSRILQGVLGNIDAEMTQDWHEDGLVVRIVLPLG